MTYVNKRSVLVVGILFIILGISAVLARFHVRRKIGLGFDDWLCIPALVSLMGLTMWESKSYSTQVLVIAECSIMITGEFSFFGKFYVQPPERVPCRIGYKHSWPTFSSWR